MDDPRPGEWMDTSGREYQRLLALARRRLIGLEHHAEDVVSVALERWQLIPADHPSARIETIIKTVAYSVIRSEQRRRDRERRSCTAAVNSGGARTAWESEHALLSLAIGQTCKRLKAMPTSADLEILELLYSGLTIADVARATGLPRHRIKRSREFWQFILAATFTEMTSPTTSP